MPCRTALILAALVSACGREQGARPAGITFLIESAPDSLDGRLALSSNGQHLAHLIAPGLVTFDEQSRPVPDLAQSFRWVDERTLEVALRPGLTFHDGSPLGAEDVRESYQSLVDGSVPNTKAGKFEAVESVESMGDALVRFHLLRPYAPLLSELNVPVVPRSRCRMPAAREQDAHPIGAGPFRFVAQPDDDHVELAAFDGYYGGPPRIRALHVRVVRDETTRLLELLKGRADLVLNSLSPEVLPQVDGKAGLSIVTAPGTAFAYLGFNVRQGPLSDRRVRQALCRLIDVEPLVRWKFHGLAHAATGMLAEPHWAYAPDRPCRYDPVGAAALLDAAGYAKPRSGPRLRLSYKTSTDRFRKAIALVLASQLEAGGIAVDLHPLEFGTFFNDVRTGNFELMTLRWSNTLEPDLLRQVFDSSQVPSEANHFGGLNRGGYGNARLDLFLEEAARVPDRKALYAQALAILAEDVPYVPLWHEDTVAVVSSHLVGFRPSPSGFLTPLAQAAEAP